MLLWRRLPRREAYVLLALEPPPGSGAPPAPDASTTQAWQTLAARYQTEPRVLFEIFASASALPANWLQSASTLATTIRALNSASVIFLGSGRGGADVTGLPLLSPSGDPFWNVVYTIAVSNTSLLGPKRRTTRWFGAVISCVCFHVVG